MYTKTDATEMYTNTQDEMYTKTDATEMYTNTQDTDRGIESQKHRQRLRLRHWYRQTPAVRHSHKKTNKRSKLTEDLLLRHSLDANFLNLILHKFSLDNGIVVRGVSFAHKKF